MARLQSHGPGSSLHDHLEQVAEIADCFEERVICVCHDIGKATEPWQAYSARGFTGESPHGHAAAGGLLATAVLRSLSKSGTDQVEWPLIALHTASGHHSHLGMINLDACRGEIDALARSPQCKAFLLDTADGIASLLPGIPGDRLEQAWTALLEIRDAVASACWRQFAAAVSALDGPSRVRCFLRSRDLLGRFCWQDCQSAKVQSGKRPDMECWQDLFLFHRAFRPRPPRRFPVPGTDLNRLRAELKTRFLETVSRSAGPFYFVDAPTGLGKTEAMLAAAEKLVGDPAAGLQRIVFAVPQVSIADQVMADYLDTADAQIWSHLRQEHAAAPLTAGEESNTGLDATLEILYHPFASSYNVTTFNQVLMAMCHPLRTLCTRSLGLRHAVIIMDEFHKLPCTVLPYFFRLARAFAEQAGCRFIFGSATPMPSTSYLGTGDWTALPPAAAQSMYGSAAVNGRRLYRKHAPMTIDAVADWIEAFHARSDDSLLVVLNLVGAGTWPLRKRFAGGYDPWADAERLLAAGDGRRVVFLDGLTPPILRRDLVSRCRTVMRSSPLTLVTTQMVEVGVDLDFDHALVDFQGLAATIQRGGRVGREGDGSHARTVEVFALTVADGDTSFKILQSVRDKCDPRFRLAAFAREQQAEQKRDRLETAFFQRQWDPAQTLTDRDLTDALLNILRNVMGRVPAADIMSGFFKDLHGAGTDWGLDFLNAQFIAELYGESGGEEVLLLESRDAFDRLKALLDGVKQKADPQTARDLRRFVAERRICTFVREVLQSPALVEVGRITELNGIRCLMRSGATSL